MRVNAVVPGRRPCGEHLLVRPDLDRVGLVASFERGLGHPACRTATAAPVRLSASSGLRVDGSRR